MSLLYCSQQMSRATRRAGGAGFLLFCFIFAIPNFVIRQPSPALVIISPQVNPDQTVVFHNLAPTAKQVSLSAQFEKDPVPMAKDSSRIWRVTVGPVEPDSYPYHFVVDGIQVAASSNMAIFPNEGFQNSLVEITSNTSLMHTMQQMPHGTLSYRYYTSPELGTRPVLIYTPSGYEKDASKKYPVIYLLHGTTDTEETWTKVGRANMILDSLTQQGKAQPMIIVMPYGRANPGIGKSSGSLRNWDNLQEFKKDFLNHLLRFVEQNYLDKTDKYSRAVAGFSGGGETLYLGLNNPELFSWVCGFAPGMLKEEFERNNAVAFAHPPRAYQQLKLFWIGVGRIWFISVHFRILKSAGPKEDKT